MKRAQILLLLLLAVAALAVLYLALRNPPPPLLPADAEHAAFAGPDACLTCHGPDGGAPHSSTHPIGRDCMRCHAMP